MNKLAFVFVVLIVSCSSPIKPTEPTVNEKTDTLYDDSYISTTPIPLAGCYTWATKNDTATVEIIGNGDKVSGKLNYKLKEKDSNIGTITGQVKDNLLITNYTFMSEGTTSVREVVFKIDGVLLIEGYGEVLVTNDTARFKDIKSLKFLTDRPFKKVECLQ